jgi:hypothetical protein
VIRNIVQIRNILQWPHVTHAIYDSRKQKEAKSTVASVLRGIVLKGCHFLKTLSTIFIQLLKTLNMIIGFIQIRTGALLSVVRTPAPPFQTMQI